MPSHVAPLYLTQLPWPRSSKPIRLRNFSLLRVTCFLVVSTHTHVHTHSHRKLPAYAFLHPTSSALTCTYLYIFSRFLPAFKLFILSLLPFSADPHMHSKHTHRHTESYTPFLCLSTRKHVSKTWLFVTHHIISHCILSKIHPCLSRLPYITNLLKSTMLHPTLSSSSTAQHPQQDPHINRISFTVHVKHAFTKPHI